LASIERQLVSNNLAPRALMGLLNGGNDDCKCDVTLGKRSGGQFNLAITFTFYRLGKVEFWASEMQACGQINNELTKLGKN
jgi:aquaporin Z